MSERIGQSADEAFELGELAEARAELSWLRAGIEALRDEMQGSDQWREVVGWVNRLDALLAASSGSLTPRSLTFAELIAANLSRVVRWHPEGLQSWTPLEWSAAMAGEAGEACNAAKKLKRITDQIANINTEEGRSLTDTRMAGLQVTKEVADTIIYGLLLVSAVGGDIEATIVDVFNRKSEEYGFPERIGGSLTPPEAK